MAFAGESRWYFFCQSFSTTDKPAIKPIVVDFHYFGEGLHPSHIGLASLQIIYENRNSLPKDIFLGQFHMCD